MIALIAFSARLAAAEPNDDLADRADELAADSAAADSAAADSAAADSAAADSAAADSAAADSAVYDPRWSEAGGADEREAARQNAPTRLGRVDLTVTWRRTVRTSEQRTIDARHPIASPLDPVTTARGELWVLATWRL